MQGEYFMKIDEPLRVRKALLESDKMIIDSFKHFESYKRMKNQKLALMQELKAMLLDLNEDNKKLQQMLPAVKIKHSKKKSISKKAAEVHEHVHFAELEDIEKQISSIEGQLKNM
jgi:hypothetical protein